MYINRAYIYKIHGDHTKALEDYETAIQIDPNNDSAHNNRSNLWNFLGEYDKAIKDS